MVLTAKQREELLDRARDAFDGSGDMGDEENLVLYVEELITEAEEKVEETAFERFRSGNI